MKLNVIAAITLFFFPINWSCESLEMPIDLALKIIANTPIIIIINKITAKNIRTPLVT